jgi:hypothetical protein
MLLGTKTDSVHSFFESEMGDFTMPTPNEYQELAAECLERVRNASEWYVKAALLELSEEFRRRAEKLDRAGQQRMAERRICTIAHGGRQAVACPESLLN